MAKDKILTIDIGASKVRIQSINRQYNILQENLASTVSANFNNEKFIEFLIGKIKLITENRKEHQSAISIGAPGLVEPEKGIIGTMPNIWGVKNLPIAKILGETFNLPVFLINDADAACIGEWQLGSGRGYKNMVYLTLGTGVGSSVVLNGELKQASELGCTFLTAGSEDRICRCGKINCAESFLGTSGLAETYAEVFNIQKSGLSPEEISSLSFKMREGVKAKDPGWLKVQEKYCDYLNLFLENVLKAYNPEVIILGGGIAFNNQSLLKTVTKKIKSKKETVVLLAQFENSVNIGAAKYAFDKLKSLHTQA
ncbi:MAG: hypothetical protein A3B91_01640 [Candidatus Yanofskybacteria bacterium RIFCSPHIGHO2_02_FULL_41_29]|uniref:Glucokinase n=1 Tax=Candidatus Yanofskybacteria bacterium RIFCSPHIGHO2_01_FULL_41_53 TaxID=1802663 RepID=A0A1F8EIV8_9BACT|nr:MAG: hypothetical protein A2650_03070 [Candidatus Yanofskybacteria bacterium RIFCSPHIGHO2_01_FULL_41_53]OGN11828.1 MAG: hypothetical protein A3B91_01640 [Candidatus Yanofskybacteria bacterium RIFCSPHIGHO2_02_FULL_41_29]OGN17266.1 MAG: hypothetical protein A3F48_03630 [Candidatus Yanofskybacteria bacterium RIFCSPHIGHO2_12_FULL_41_9]OGN23076.1 MAG: hypothetical protein A2916_04990 [Candidatus Yanofskybacteria bacterium RIFCSPLOWO2_01_FULL_41_67]OGN29879.1 MAG: hypothetical protein A3H54_03745 